MLLAHTPSLNVLQPAFTRPDYTLSTLHLFWRAKKIFCVTGRQRNNLYFSTVSESHSTTHIKKKNLKSECILGILLFLVQRTEFLNNCPVVEVIPSAVLHMWCKDFKKHDHIKKKNIMRTAFPGKQYFHFQQVFAYPVPLWGHLAAVQSPHRCAGDPAHTRVEQTSNSKRQPGASRWHPSISRLSEEPALGETCSRWVWWKCFITKLFRIPYLLSEVLAYHALLEQNIWENSILSPLWKCDIVLWVQGRSHKQDSNTDLDQIFIVQAVCKMKIKFTANAIINQKCNPVFPVFFPSN